MQEEINEALDLEVDYLSAIADMLNEFGFLLSLHWQWDTLSTLSGNL